MKLVQGIRPEDVERLTREVLSRPEFTPSPWESLRKSFFLWLSQWALAHPLVFRFLALILIVAVILALGLALWKLVSGLLRYQTEESPTPLDASPSWNSLEGRAAGWDEALGKARHYLSLGQLYEAIWMAHRSLLALLDYRGALKFAGWKTNRDYLKECRPGPAFDLLQAVSGVYETVVYAHGEVEGEWIAQLLQRIEAEKADGPD